MAKYLSDQNGEFPFQSGCSVCKKSTDYVLDSTQGQGLIVASGKDLMEEVKKKLNF